MRLCRKSGMLLLFSLDKMALLLIVQRILHGCNIRGDAKPAFESQRALMNQHRNAVAYARALKTGIRLKAGIMRLQVIDQMVSVH